MKKRLLSLGLSVMLIVGLVPQNAYAEEGECQHEFEACKGVDPTCTEDGWVEYACINCWNPEVSYQEEIPATGHVWENHVCSKCGIAEEGECQHEFEACKGVDPTCTASGWVEYACIKCWDSEVSYRETVPATDHIWGVYLCSKCGKRKSVLVLTDGTGMFSYFENDDGTVVITEYKGNETDIRVPETISGKTVVGIGEEAFMYKRNISNIQLPDTIQRIGDNAFNSCLSLETMSIPNGVLYIGLGAFSNCIILERVFIPDSVLAMGLNRNSKGSSVSGEVFSNCKKCHIYCESEFPKEGWYESWNGPCEVTCGVDFEEYKDLTGENSYNITYELNGGVNNENNPPVYYSNIDTYLYAPRKEGFHFAGWYTDEQFENKVPFIEQGTRGDICLFAKWQDEPIIIENGQCGVNVTWTLDSEKNLIISGTGAMYGYSYSGNLSPFAEENYNSITIESGVSDIGSYCFYKTQAPKVSLPSTITAIQSMGFYYSKIAEIELNEGLEIIDGFAFAYNKELARLDIPSTVKRVNWWSVENTNIKEIVLKNYFKFSMAPSSTNYGMTLYYLHKDFSNWSKSIDYYDQNNHGLLNWKEYCCLSDDGTIITDHEIEPIDIEPTCITDGLLGEYCNQCSTYISGGESIPKTGHAWDEGNVIAMPSYTEDGTIRYTCMKCGDLVEEVVPKLICSNHVWGDETIIKQPSYTESGEKQYVCSVCGEVKKEGIPKKVPFNDVPLGRYYSDSVYAIANAGIITGYENGYFGVGDVLTREQFATILYRTYGNGEKCGSANYKDENKISKFAQDAVAWAQKYKYIKGSDEGYFSPRSPLTREQMCVILYRMNGSKSVSANLNAYEDGSKISPFAVDAMKWAVANEIVGVNTTRLNPRDNCYREQAATILARILVKEGRITM